MRTVTLMLSAMLIAGCSRDPGYYCTDKANHKWGQWENAGSSGHFASLVQVRHCTVCNVGSVRWVRQKESSNH